MVKIAIDGNIGCGKSTVIEKLKNWTDFKKVYSEDIASWGDWLEKYYEDPKKYALGFQLTVLLSHLRQQGEVDDDGLYIYERCSHTCNRIFGSLLVEDGIMSERELESAFTSAKSEAKAAFGDDRVYMERYLQKPRHIEVQIIGDKFGNTVHLGERECSIQRRHQKVIEEAPSPAIDQTTRDKIGNIASMAVAKMGYLGLGTIEFLYEDGQFFFIEMNTRLQVEHPITEAITGIDLVKEQIMIAAGQPISFKQSDVKFNGHAIECRINAEDPKTFIPSPGKITQFHSPCGLGIRIESCVYSGYVVPPYYDSLIAKLIVHASDREQCILRLKQALKEIVIEPISTTIDLHKDILETSVMKDGSYDIRWLENKLLNNN